MLKGLKSLLAGLLAGTAIGVLFSPEKGSKIRKDLKSEFDKGGTGIKTLKSTMQEMGKDIGDTCKDTYDDVSQSEEFKAGKAKVKEYSRKAKKEAEKFVKKNVPAKTRKKVTKTVKKAKDTVKKAQKSAKKTVNKISSKLKNSDKNE